MSDQKSKTRYSTGGVICRIREVVNWQPINSKIQCHVIGLSLFLICALKAKDAVHWCVDIIREATYVFLCLATWCTKNWVINRRQQVIYIYIPFKLNAFKALEQTEEICFRLPLRYIDIFHTKWRQYRTCISIAAFISCLLNRLNVQKWNWLKVKMLMSTYSLVHCTYAVSSAEIYERGV